MVAQHQHGVVAEVADQSFLLVEGEGDAFVVVVADAPVELHRHLVQRQQPAGLRGHRAAGAGVGVQHALGILAGGVDGAVDHEAGRVDLVRRRLHRLAVEVDLHQAGGGDLVEHQPIRIDQEVMFRSRQAHRDVGEYQVAHAEMRDQAVAGRQFLAQFPFLGRAGGAGNRLGRHGGHSCLLIGKPGRPPGRRPGLVQAVRAVRSGARR
ncbi:hypothetical protein D3C81_1461220 [compost metagenome]